MQTQNAGSHLKRDAVEQFACAHHAGSRRVPCPASWAQCRNLVSAGSGETAGNFSGRNISPLLWSMASRASISAESGVVLAASKRLCRSFKRGAKKHEEEYGQFAVAA